MLSVSWTIYLLVIALSGVDARAVNTNTPSLPTSNISSSMLSGPINAIASSQSCTDIKTCRTLDQIVVSCLVTILACVWFAVHRNVPAPRPKRSGHANFRVSKERAWSVVLGWSEAVMVFAVALLAPEWILAWALRQAIVAWKLASRLEEAREAAVEEQQGRSSKIFNSQEDEGHIVASADGHLSIDGSTGAHTDSEEGRLIKRRSSSSTVHVTCQQCNGSGNPCDQVAAQKRVAKGDERWVWSHAFFVAMGGFQFYNTHGPLHPLSPKNVVELVGRGHLVPPTADEILNQSKGDALSKVIAIAQTLWFVVQCIARRAKHLPMTSLEVMTLAYTVMTLAMYAAWWEKPLNVSCVVRVPEEQVEEEDENNVDYASIWQRIFIYVMGGQDRYVDLRQCTRVPTFWAGNADIEDFAIADFIALVVAMVFGAVHCVAWSFEFQSHLEQQLWRLSTVAIITVPVALIVVTGVAFLTTNHTRINPELFIFLVGGLYMSISIVYIAARLTLIILSFSSLIGLPFGAYQTVQWTTFIPHI